MSQFFTNTSTVSAPICLEDMYRTMEKLKEMAPAFDEIHVSPFIYRRIMRHADGRAAFRDSAWPHMGLALVPDYMLAPWELEKRLRGELVEKCELADLKAEFEKMFESWNPLNGA